jgi:hypothetical protein
MKTAETRKTSKNLLVILRSLVGLIGLFLLLAAFTFWPASYGVPSFNQVRAAHSRSESVLLDRHEEIIHELRTNNTARRLDWLPIQSVSPAQKKSCSSISSSGSAQAIGGGLQPFGLSDAPPHSICIYHEVGETSFLARKYKDR